MIRAACVTLPFVALVITLTACRDHTLGEGTAPSPDTQRTAQLVVEPAASSDTLVTVALRVSGVATASIGSVTAAVLYDSTRLHFRRELSMSDGAMRATHATNGQLRIAAAHALGFDGEVLARVQFAVTDTAALRTMSLQIRELHLLDASDARPTLTTLPVEVVR